VTDEQIEAIYRATPKCIDGTFNFVDFGRAIEKAARAQAIEEAARLIEPRQPPEHWTDYARIRAEAATNIRALKGE
jgi:hypothetical protein